MDKFVIRGGNPLVGTVRVSGAKNSALPSMAAAILTEDEVTLENIPQVHDIETERRLLAAMGASVELPARGVPVDRSSSTGWEGERQDRTIISCRTLSDPVARYEIVKTMRASSLVLGPLVARFGRADVAMPGGCAIGGRPIDLHLKGLEKMGAQITQEHGYLKARASRLRGVHLVFDKITVTGTEDLLMAAVLAEGETLMENCAREPEVADLARLLTAMGAKIEGAGTATIRVQGVSRLHGARYRINPDRIEAGTFLIAGAITGGDLIVANCHVAHLGAVIAKLLEAGVRVDILGPDTVRVRMGANIKVDGSTATVRGPARLSAAAVMCSDLRASASLVLAALVAEGETVIDRVYHMDRGYERFEQKLSAVGAQIQRMGNVFAPREEEKIAG